MRRTDRIKASVYLSGGSAFHYLVNGVVIHHLSSGAAVLSKDGHRFKFYESVQDRDIESLARAYGG